MNMPLDDFLTTLYCNVDDWYQKIGKGLLSGKPGPEPSFADSEVLTLAIGQPFNGTHFERAWVRYVRNNLKHLFPKMLSQSQYNRRVRMLFRLLEQLRQYLLECMDARSDPYRIMDSAPIIVRHWRRYGPGHLTMPGATLGYCAAKRMTFYGYRLLLLVRLDGLPTDWVLISANADERAGAQELLEEYFNLVVIGDKGFIDQEWKEQNRETHHHDILTPKRRNQHVQNSKELNKLIHHFRSRIETTFSQLDGQFHLEHPEAHTWWGLLTRIVMRMVAITMAAWLNFNAGHPLLQVANLSV
jgi:hypothetical protein